MSEPCHRGCTCGCCEGVEVLTPQEIANRPGLDALAYRAGLHSTFLETMRARLSSRDYKELKGLATREASDLSLALLDAWAVVADVLTFYQERIANEGYLRTATERRSVLELARLVGYAPRPGVAASTHLAYTLDEGAEVTIPAGSRAQSVPAPGELPQPFETSEELPARAVWNELRVRRTRPQTPAVIGTGVLHLQGIVTRLEPNDPLLIKTDAGQKPRLYRVMEVEPDEKLDRTKVSFVPWRVKPPETEAAAVGVAVSPIAEPALTRAAPETAAKLRRAVDRLRDLEAFEVSPGSATARRSHAHLEPLVSHLDSGAAEPALRKVVEEQVLPKLREEHRLAVEGNFTRLEPWLRQSVAALETALEVEAAPADASRLAAPPTPVPAPAPAPQAVASPPAAELTADLSDVLSALVQRRSIPFRAARLDAEVARAFSPGSDVNARLLSLTQPRLHGILYTAWANAPVTREPVLEVWALRLRARVFGHNAPLELVRRPRDGVILGTKEWDLVTAGKEESEQVSIVTGHASDRTLLLTRIQIAGLEVTDRHPLTDSTFTIDFPAAAERITVTVSRDTFELTYRFRTRGILIVLSVPERGMPFVAHSEGLDPIRVSDDHLSDEGSRRTVTVEGEFQNVSPGKSSETEMVVFLDNSYPKVLPGSWIVLERPDTRLDPEERDPTPLVVTTVEGVAEQSRVAYGITGKATRAALTDRWLRLTAEESHTADTFAVIRGTAVYAQSEQLELAEEPIAEPVCEDQLELAGLHDGLQAGRWLIVSGARSDVVVKRDSEEVEVPGVPAAELVKIAGVEQGFDPLLPGDRNHTTLLLAEPLEHCYERDDVKVWGNVAPATHGETKAEVLGSGDASKPMQRFALKQSPLTYVSAATSSGVESTLRVRVNDLLWHAAENLFGVGPTDRIYTTRRSDEEETTVVFGDGTRGARPPTGNQNLRAVYRAGIGNAGNLGAGRISQLATRPLGVKDVVNPLPATGGADPESRDQARRNAPLAVMALDRLVSVRDYADFARTFAGIGKASAARLSDGRAQLVQVTIAGEDDIPIDDTSDLFRNLGEALRRFGDPDLPLQVAVRDLALLVVAAGVRLLPDYDWDKVAPQVRAALLAAFAFARRDLAQDALLTEAVRAVQGVPGVDYVDVDVFDFVKGTLDKDELKRRQKLVLKTRIPALPARVEGNDGARTIRPAELIYLSPAVPDTVILKELKA